MMGKNVAEQFPVRLHLVFAADENFITQLKVASFSAVFCLTNSKVSAVVHILDCGIENRTWQIYEHDFIVHSRRCNVEVGVERHIIKMSEFEAIRAWNGSRAAYARVLLPSLLPNVAFCVYADCDILFLQSPLGILDELIRSDKMIVGHKNPAPVGGECLDFKWLDSVGVPYARDKYFCSGLIGLNLDKIRKVDGERKLLAFLRDYPDSIAPDQTALNWLSRDDVELLTDGWGVFTDECYDASLTVIKAIHYVGGWPWKSFSWYEYVMERQLDDMWRWFCAEYANEPGFLRRSRFDGLVVGFAALCIAKILSKFNLNCPNHPRFVVEFRRRQAAQGLLVNAWRSLGVESYGALKFLVASFIGILSKKCRHMFYQA